jgi:hypothetical protein
MTKNPIKHIHVQRLDEGRVFSENEAADALRYLATDDKASLTVIYEDGKYFTSHWGWSSYGRMTEDRIKEFIG